MAGKYSLTMIPLKDEKSVKVYASPKIGQALRDIMSEMPLYDGVRLTQVFEAIYVQGKKDGARDTFDGFEKRLAEARKVIPHRNPGRPRKKKK